MRRLNPGLLGGLCLLPLPAFAHTGVNFAGVDLAGAGWGGWTAGFLHPFHGWDHVVVMIAVGLWATLQRRWWLPLVFASVMLLGAGAAFIGLHVPGVEPAILISTVTMGAFALFRVRFAAAAGFAVVALFAFFHGFAHGAEMPVGAHALAYMSGFVTGSLVLHAVGYAAAYAAGQLHLLKAKKAASTRHPKAAR